MSSDTLSLARMLGTHIALPVALGLGATALLDAWNTALKRVLGVASLNYCLLGRWVTHMPSGVFRHRNIALSAAGRWECVLGWVSHYGIGAGLSVLFVMMVGRDWLAHPTIVPAIVFGVATVVLPFFVMQPALGLGVASAATRNPWRARVKSVATHAVYGVGLYLSACVAEAVLFR